MFIWIIFISKILFSFHPFNHKSETTPINQSDLKQKVEGTIRSSAEKLLPNKPCLFSRRISYLCSSTKAARACWTQHCLLQAPKCDNAKTAWGAQQGHLQQREKVATDWIDWIVITGNHSRAREKQQKCGLACAWNNGNEPLGSHSVPPSTRAAPGILS